MEILLKQKDEEIAKLKKSYAALQSDYTRKCQFIKTNIKEDNLENIQTSSKTQFDFDNLENDDFIKTHIITNEKIRNVIILDYILNLATGQNTPVFINDVGSFVKSERIIPKTFSEAGELARRTLIIK